MFIGKGVRLKVYFSSSFFIVYHIVLLFFCPIGSICFVDQKNIFSVASRRNSYNIQFRMKGSMTHINQIESILVLVVYSMFTEKARVEY